MTQGEDIGSIPLTESESALAAQIQFRRSALGETFDVEMNGKVIGELLRSLDARSAIPKQRWRYFADPDFNIGGRGKSYKSVFERNGCHGQAILEHPHFLRFLRYILHGADLPKPIKDSFLERVNECGPVTSGDVTPLAKLARSLTREYRLEPADAAEEFYKLALDCGLDQSYAAAMRESVKQVRYR